jgi:simple sugar transport system permease protein
MALTPGLAARGDERTRSVARIRLLLGRPETGAIVGTILVWLLFAGLASSGGFLTFAGTANYLQVASEVGILGIPVTLLMIAGEFDLSVGSMIGASGMVLALTVKQLNWPIEAGIVAAFVFAMAYGLLNGLLVVRTRLPSFLVTLGGLFLLRGLTLALGILFTGFTQVSGLEAATAKSAVAPFFAADLGSGFKVSVIWWLALALFATWVLMRTSFGNWIFACGGSREGARSMGVPINRVRVSLFVATAASAALVAVIQTLEVHSADGLRGQLKEFEAIIEVVIGGTLLSGGYGSVIGTVFGALTLGIISQGLFFAEIDPNWYRATLGVLLLVAVLVNEFVRRRAVGVR